MKALIDTHIILWALSDNPKLSDKAKKILLEEKNKIYCSLISLFEIELKHIAKPDIVNITAEDIYEYCKGAGFEFINISEESIFLLEYLKRKRDTPPHKDPFDRLLLCQAIENKMKFITHDFLITGYDTGDDEVIIYV